MAVLPLPVAILDDIISAAAILDGVIQDDSDGNDVWRTSGLSWKRPPDVCPASHESCRPHKRVQDTSCRHLTLLLLLRSIWPLASPRHYRGDWRSCPLATTRKWSVCTCQHHVPWNVVLTSASSYAIFFLFFGVGGIYVFIFLPLSPPGWRGIVVTVRAGGRLPNLRNPYLCNRLMDFLHSKFCGIV